MTTLYLDTATLSAKADELEELDNLFLEEIQKLDDTEQALASMWEGPAKDSFRTAYHKDSTQMRNFYSAIRVYVMQLRLIIATYKRIECINSQIGENRTY